MEIRIPKLDNEIYVDRDDTLNDYHRQGFDVWIQSVKIHFEDEEDAVTMAKMILYRKGIRVIFDDKDLAPVMPLVPGIQATCTATRRGNT
jgi:hypothetical protein